MSVTRHRFLHRSLVPAVLIVASLGLAVPASAAPPLTVARHITFHPAFDFYDCGDFVVQAEWDVTVTFTQYFAPDGSETKFMGHVSYVGTLSHPQNGRWVDDRGVHTFVDDLTTGTTRDAGGYRHVTAPGEGTLVLDVGFASIAWNDPTDPFDDSFLRLAGPKDELEGKTEALCAYLRG